MKIQQLNQPECHKFRIRLISITLLILGVIHNNFGQAEKPSWIIKSPQEIVTYMIFDLETVNDKIPPSIKLTTVQEVAKADIAWAKQHLTKFPGHRKWGISFFEIIKAETFSIDGKQPDWPENGAIGVWFARISTIADSLLGKGQPFLALEFWVPDSDYVDYMNQKGYYATYKDVQLFRHGSDFWTGKILSDNLNLTVNCQPLPESEYSGTFGRQCIYSHLLFPANQFIQIEFKGHRIQTCDSAVKWNFDGTHPLAKAIPIGPTTYQHNYSLKGKIMMNKAAINNSKIFY